MVWGPSREILPMEKTPPAPPGVIHAESKRPWTEEQLFNVLIVLTTSPLRRSARASTALFRLIRCLAKHDVPRPDELLAALAYWLELANDRHALLVSPLFAQDAITVALRNPAMKSCVVRKRLSPFFTAMCQWIVRPV